MQDFEFIDSCMKKVINGNSISFDEAERLISTNNLIKLADCANIITKKFNQETVDVESLINAKSGNCPEDCSFCAQREKHKLMVLPVFVLSVLIENLHKMILKKFA